MRQASTLQPPLDHHHPAAMSAPHLFCDTSVGDWRLLFPSFERYDQYERERLAYRDSVAENRSRYTGYHQPQHPEHMGYTGLPLPLQQSTPGAPPAQQPSIAEHNWGVQNEDFLQPNSSNSLTNQPQRNAPQTFGPQSAYEQVFRSTMSQYPHPEQPSAPYSPFIHEQVSYLFTITSLHTKPLQGTRKPTERTVGPPLAMINATLSSSAGAFQHARRPKPPQMKTEANAHAAASDKKRHDEIVAKGFVQDDLCGQCRVKQRLTPAHKCIKIETIDKDGKVEKGRCHYCVIRRQKCAVETAQDAQDRMYGRRHKKEDEFVKKENEAVKVKKEKKTEAKKVEAQETGDARAYNAAFRAQDDHEEPWDITQRLQQPLHGHGMPVGDAQGVPHAQGFISQIQSFTAHGHPARSHTPTDYATYPPGQPEQYRYGPQFPMPGYAESLSDNVLGVMNQGRRHTGQQLPSPISRPQSAEQGSYYNSNRQDMYGQRTLRPPLAPAQHNPLNSNSSRYAGYSSHIAANPLKPFAPGCIGRPTQDNLHNEHSRHPGQYNDKSPYNERIPYTPGPNPYGSPAQEIGRAHV